MLGGGVGVRGSPRSLLPPTRWTASSLLKLCKHPALVVKCTVWIGRSTFHGSEHIGPGSLQLYSTCLCENECFTLRPWAKPNTRLTLNCILAVAVKHEAISREVICMAVGGPNADKRKGLNLAYSGRDAVSGYSMDTSSPA